MTNVRRAVALSLAERYLLIVLALASSIILARLLTPEQIGIYSVSLAVIGIAQVLRDFGIGNYLIQEQNLQESHIRTAFGMSLILGGSLFLTVFLLAPLAGHFYGEQRMITTLRIVSLNFLVLPFCTISLALLRREMQFARMLYINLTATVIGVGATLGMAIAGWGPDSMAVGSVLGNVATGLGSWLARPERRGLRPSLSQWQAILRFGGQSSLAGVVTTISMDANDLVVGKILGFHPAAILSRAQGLMNLFNRDLMSAVRGVALPAFAAAHRSQSDVEAQYVRSMANITVLAWPFYGLVSLYALEAVRLLFGPQWDEATPLVPFFCIAGAVAAVNALTPTVLVAVGRIDLVTRVELMMQPLRLALVVGAVLIFKTTFACAVAYMLSSLIALPVFQAFKRRGLPSASGQSLRYLGLSAIVALAALAPPSLHVWLTGIARVAPLPLTHVVGVCLASVATGAAAAFLVRHPIAQEPWLLAALSRIGVGLGIKISKEPRL